MEAAAGRNDRRLSSLRSATKVETYSMKSDGRQYGNHAAALYSSSFCAIWPQNGQAVLPKPGCGTSAYIRPFP